MRTIGPLEAAVLTSPPDTTYLLNQLAQLGPRKLISQFRPASGKALRRLFL